MKCVDCTYNRRGVTEPDDAEWILWDSANDKYIPLCQGCLEVYITHEGEIHLDFWLLDGIKSGMSITVFLRHVNDILEGKKRQMDYLYKRVHELKK